MTLQLLYPVDPRSRVSWDFGALHKGVDFAVVVGTPVYSAAAGRVLLAQEATTNYGIHVRIGHQDGSVQFSTIYGHLSKLNVNAGDWVEAHTLIGLSGNTGQSSGPHLHIEKRNSWVGGSPVDPRPFIPWVEELPVVALPDFPSLPRVKVTNTSWLHIRKGPGLGYGSLGSLRLGEVVDVMSVVVTVDDIWLRLGYNQYCAMKIGTKLYAIWLDPNL